MSNSPAYRRQSAIAREITLAAFPRADLQSRSEPGRWISPVWIVAALLAVSAPLYFVRGIGIFDDSVHLKIGQLILDGLKPYRDFYDNKPPGLYYVSAAIAAVGGRGWLAPRIFLFLFAAAFQFGVCRWLQRVLGGRVAMIAGVLLGLSYPLCQGYSLHTEPFGAAAAFAACALVFTAPTSTRRWAAAGLLLGLATIFKQTGVLYVAALGGFAIYDSRRRQEKGLSGVTRVISLSAGFAVVLVVVAVAFIVQGLGAAMFDAAVTDAFLRAGDGGFSLLDIRDTWMRSPALLAFLGVAFLLVSSSKARHAMDERRRDAFVLFAAVGMFAVLPTLRQNGVGHYLQPSAFAFAIACAIFLDSYLRVRTGLVTIVAAATVTFVAGYFVALCDASVGMVRQNKLRSDLELQRELRQTLDTRLDPNDTVLCVSASSAAKLYLMSGRRPFNRSLYFYSNVDRYFSLADARRVLAEGRPAAALVDIDPLSERPEFYEDELAALRPAYEIIPLGPQTAQHRLLALVRYKRTAGSDATRP